MTAKLRVALIVSALNLALSAAAAGQERVPLAVDSAVRLSRGQLRIDILVDSTRFPAAGVELAELTLPPGGPAPGHRHGADELIYVLDGELEHTVNGASRRLGPGMVGYVRTGDTVNHRVASAAPVRALVVWAPGGEAARIRAALGGGTPVAIGSAAHDSAALGRLRDEWTAAYNEGRVDPMRDLYTADAVRMPYDAPAQVGRDSIVTGYERGFAARRMTPKIVLTPAEVEMRGDLSIERGSYDEVLTPRGAGRPIREVGKYVSVARRGVDGKWRFQWSMFNRDAATAR